MAVPPSRLARPVIIVRKLKVEARRLVTCRRGRSLQCRNWESTSAGSLLRVSVKEHCIAVLAEAPVVLEHSLDNLLKDDKLHLCTLVPRTRHTPNTKFRLVSPFQFCV